MGEQGGAQDEGALAPEELLAAVLLQLQRRLGQERGGRRVGAGGDPVEAGGGVGVARGEADGVLVQPAGEAPGLALRVGADEGVRA